ncbi:hypothetical protein [Intestinibacter sp.]|uniref:hypothetical protein n=1 Tax=Intestinibacter sp. TaxID=1965304 RepID=UPI003F16ABA4
MSRPNRVENRYYNYPESGRIDTFLNTYDIPIIGDALSLVDAAKYALRRDWNNASTSFLDAASPLAMFTKSTKLNWKDWGAKSKYIPEYE